MKYKKHSFSFAKITLGLLAIIPLTGAGIDPDNRWEVRDFYNYVYFYGTDAEMGWTGSYQPFDIGTVNQDWLDATLVRINFFREMAGIPADVTFDPALNLKCQAAAIIMSANGGLSHFPGTELGTEGWVLITPDGYEAAGKSNIAWGSAGPDAVTGFMADPGTSNFIVGHRRWFLFPQSKTMGSGDVAGSELFGFSPANSIWVQDEDHIFDPTPWDQIRNADGSITWPPSGYVPSDLVWGRWSITYPDADFSNATVTMTMGASNIPLVLEPYSFSGGLPEETLVWVPNGMVTDTAETWPTPTEDETVEVTINNVSGSGVPTSFNYTVKIFDPDKDGPGEYATTLTPPGTIETNVPVPFQATTRPGWSEGVQGRVIGKHTYTTVHTAEGDVLLFEDMTDASYNVIQSDWTANGSKAFQLYHDASFVLEPQILKFAEKFVVTSASPKIIFKSSLSLVGSAQLASVDVLSDNDTMWESVWESTGPVNQNVSSFTAIEVDLSSWIGEVIQIRFRYDFTGGSFFAPQPGFNVGWALDDIALGGLEEITSTTLLAEESGDTIHPTFMSMDSVYLQARELAFGGFPLNWGPLLEVTPSGEGSYDIPVGEWSDDPIFGQVYGFQDSWAYSPVIGWFNYGEFPWLYSPSSGWMRYMQGTLMDGLWLYHGVDGFVFTREDFGTAYSMSPFDAGSWGSFHP